jgi:hypothetical protein
VLQEPLMRSAMHGRDHRRPSSRKHLRRVDWGTRTAMRPNCWAQLAALPCPNVDGKGNDKAKFVSDATFITSTAQPVLTCLQSVVKSDSPIWTAFSRRRTSAAPLPGNGSSAAASLIYGCEVKGLRCHDRRSTW